MRPSGKPPLTQLALLSLEQADNPFSIENSVG